MLWPFSVLSLLFFSSLIISHLRPNLLGGCYIHKFIDIHLPAIQPEDDLIKVFNEFWNQEKIEAITQICKDEDLNEEKFHQIISEYNFTGKEPLRETVFSACNQKLKLKERKEVYPRIIDKLRNLITKFDDNLGDIEEKEYT